ncbi:globin [Methylocella silvestris BL2]|uniref:Globin n=1 Tax=Methylocella silvestris (strain DSM 15510 / CIP 108128 / LMG 27833 / NCIMB 13906 / BL2) TaxID=395965 RepID=B8EMJ1_METSB|nr:globin [Methylocella silvestris BL2]
MMNDIEDPAARRAQIVARLRVETGVDEEMIETLIRAFYARVRDDELIGPIFAARIDDWEPHLQKMFAFWSSLILMTGAYHGQPMRLHAPLPIDGAHFDRWLLLFEQTARDVCPPDAAAIFVDRARRVAESLELGVAVSNGALLGKGERYKRIA